MGSYSLYNNSTGGGNVAIGYSALSDHTTGSYNTALGFNVQTSNYSGSVILGANAYSTADNQFVVGSTSYNAGTVTTETSGSTQTWSVIINGVPQKILLA